MLLPFNSFRFVLAHYSVPDVSTLFLRTLSWESYWTNDIQSFPALSFRVPVQAPLVGPPAASDPQIREEMR